MKAKSSCVSSSYFPSQIKGFWSTPVSKSAGEGKIVSVFEPHTKIIRKGKASKR